MAERNYDFRGVDYATHRISEAVPIRVPGGTDEDGITDAGDVALDEAARVEARSFLDAWPEQSGVVLNPSGQRSLTQTVWRNRARCPLCPQSPIYDGRG